MSICQLVQASLPRSIGRALLAITLVLAPAAGVGMSPLPAAAQDAIDFRTALEGYGQWVQHPRWGEVWIPEQVPQDWQPYRIGHWVYTDEWGWYWDSEEDFGWITYHYGRWVFDRGLGWIWIPNGQWGPAWVDWRQGDDFVGWAPLPPDEYLDDDYQTPDTYMFVRAGDLLAPQVYLLALPPRERFVYYNRSFLVNRTVFVRGTRIGVNPGVPPAFIARASGRPFRPVSLTPIVLAGTAGVAGAVILREQFRDRDRTRIQIRETDRFVQPNDRFVPLKPLQKGDRGQLGGITPSAARGVGIETKTLGSGGPQFRDQTIQQDKTFQQKTFQQQEFQKKALQDKNIQDRNLQKNLQQEGVRKDLEQKKFESKKFEDKKFEQKKFDGGTQNQFRNQSLQQQNLQNQQNQQNQQQQQIRREQFERKDQLQNFERKTFQQNNPPAGTGGQMQQQNVQRLQQQNTQKPQQPQNQPKDKNKQPPQ